MTKMQNGMDTINVNEKFHWTKLLWFHSHEVFHGNTSAMHWLVALW